MAKPPVPAEISEMLSRPNPAVISTVRPDGQPVSVATWYLWEAGRILVNMDAGRRRLEHLRNDPRVSLTVLDADSWYTHVSLLGRVVEMRDDTGLVDIDRLSTFYNGQAYPKRDSDRVSAWIAVESWHGWGRFKQA